MSKVQDAIALVSPLVVGGIGGAATAQAIPTWYRTLEKPEWNPPDAIFAPVWTTLYLLMGVAMVIVQRRAGGGDRVRVAQAAFAVQLALNLAWSLVFFGRREIGAALVVIVALLVAILVTIGTFGRVSRLAALLLVPYLAWTTFATLLNAEIWRLNEG